MIVLTCGVAVVLLPHTTQRETQNKKHRVKYNFANIIMLRYFVQGIFKLQEIRRLYLSYSLAFCVMNSICLYRLFPSLTVQAVVPTSRTPVDELVATQPVRDAALLRC